MKLQAMWAARGTVHPQPFSTRSVGRQGEVFGSLIRCVLRVSLCCPFRAVHADDASLDAAYGAGVHAYFDGDFFRSHQILSGAVAAGSTDPRVFYFRGLALLRLQREADGLADFAAGADREATGWNTRLVSRSLERVQGPDRLLLERARSGARLAVRQRQESAAASRYKPSAAAGSFFSGPRNDQDKTVSSGSRAGQPRPAAEPRKTAPAPDDAGPRSDDLERVEVGPTMNPRTDSLDRPRSADPFADDPFGENAFNRPKMRSDTQRDQLEEQIEMRASEAADVSDQREAQAERNAAAGDN
jgi:hypothetical protein